MMSVLLPLCSGLDVACYAEKAASSAFTSMVNAFGKGTVEILKFLSSVWMKVPSPTVATGSGNSYAPVKALSDMQLWLGPLTGTIAVCAFAIQLANLARKADRTETDKLLRQLLAVAAAPVAIVALTQIMIAASDAFSPWVIEQATGQPGLGLEAIISNQALTQAGGAGAGEWLFLFLLCTLGSLAQAIFMVIRGPVLMLLLIFLGPTSAASASQQGWHRFKRLLMLIVAFVLYKPAAAIIYAFGLTLITSNGDSMTNALDGLAVIALATLALPALIKFLAPDAALGSSSMASGAAMVGAIAAGATLVGGFAGGASAGGAGAGASPRVNGAGNPGPTPSTNDAPASGTSHPAPSTGSGGGGGGGGGGARFLTNPFRHSDHSVQDVEPNPTEGAA